MIGERGIFVRKSALPMVKNRKRGHVLANQCVTAFERYNVNAYW